MIRVVVQAPAVERPTLAAMRESLVAAGVEFTVARQAPGTSVVEHLIGILESVKRPDAMLLRLEDDVEVGRHLLENLRAWSYWQTPVLGTLYHCPKAPGNVRGRGALRPPKPEGDVLRWPFGTYLYGACGILVRGDVARDLAAELRRLVADPPAQCWSNAARRLMQDQSLCEAAARLGVPVVGHWPPLVEHRGVAASTWRPTPYPDGTGTTCGLFDPEWRASSPSS